MFDQLVEFHVENGQPITTLAISEDGKTLVSGGKDRCIRRWDIEAGECDFHRGHHWAVSEICISSDGNSVASVSQGKCRARFKSDAVLWDLRTRKTTTLPTKKGFRFRSPTFLSPEVVAFKCGDISLFDVQSGKNGQAIPESMRGDTFVVSPDHRRVVFGTWNGPLHVWDVESQRLDRKLVGHDSQVTAIAFDDSGERIASYSDEVFCIWKIGGPEPLGRLDLEIEEILCVGFCQLASKWFCLESNRRLTWIDPNGEICGTTDLPGNSTLTSAAWSRSASVLVLSDKNGVIRVGTLGSVVETDTNSANNTSAGVESFDG